MAKKKSVKANRGSWLVTLRATVTKTVVCEDCTEEQAREQPYEHAVDETEQDQADYEVLSVEPNV